MKKLLYAIELPDQVKDALGDLRNHIEIPGLQWIDRNLLRAALFFVDETTGDVLEKASRNFGELPHAAPFRLQFSAIKPIYQRNKLTILAAAFVPGNALMETARQTAALLSQPLAPEPVAHVALARMQGSRPACFREQDFPSIGHLNFQATEISLMASPLHNGSEARPLMKAAAK